MIDTSSKYLLRALLAIAATLLTAPAYSSNDAPDHPLLSRYPGAELRDYRQVDYETIDVPMGRSAGAADSSFMMAPKVGDVTRHFYELRHVSTLKLYENYRDAVQRSGLRIIYTCKLDECGDEDQAERLGGLLSLTGSV